MCRVPCLQPHEQSQWGMAGRLSTCHFKLRFVSLDSDRGCLKRSMPKGKGDDEMETHTGKIYGRTIQLDHPASLVDGSDIIVTISIRGSSQGNGDETRRFTGAGLLATEGALAGDSEWEQAMVEIAAARSIDRAEEPTIP